MAHRPAALALCRHDLYPGDCAASATKGQASVRLGGARRVGVPKMTPLRSPDLQMFLTRAEAVIRRGSGADQRMRAAAERIFTALQAPSTQGEPRGTARLPVCHHLPTALQQVRGQPGPVGALADAFAAIEQRLHWTVRAGAATQGELFLNGHANATIVGSDEGLEIRPDVRIGVSLMAPNVRYPDHRHPPEEIYVVLSDGQWRQASGPWHDPGIGGLV